MKINEERIPLDALDPEGRDPGYWEWLHRRIMAAASLELARRRSLEDLTVSGVLMSWSRAVVPTALLAAALATLLLLSEPEGPEASLGTEDEVLVSEDPESAGWPFFQEDTSPEEGVTFAALPSF